MNLVGDFGIANEVAEIKSRRPWQSVTFDTVDNGCKLFESGKVGYEIFQLDQSGHLLER